MNKRYARRMLRRMESGEPVEVRPARATLRHFSELTALAEQFGYVYEDVRRDAGPQGSGYAISIVPDPRPEARERAAAHRAAHPRAADGGELPPLVPAEVELLRARIGYDLVAGNTTGKLAVVSVVGLTVLAVCLGIQLGVGLRGALVIAVGWALVTAIVPVGYARNRRYVARQEELLRDAGFTPVTEPDGRLRFLPPQGQAPGAGGSR
ncbi:hypothetical protein ACIRPP_17570 [Streptomyces sp. NPDC101219]|uniref:hypothetical protein n=1 Tax=Streptomyces sp. NPDC101219 TaxID=3366131 RepID=UPI00380E94C5